MLTAWLSYSICLIAALTGAVAILIPAARCYGSHEISGMGELLLAVGGPLFILVSAVYLGDIVWLFFARNALSHSEASAVVNFGPSSRFDRWLLNTIVPKTVDR